MASLISSILMVGAPSSDRFFNVPEGDAEIFVCRVGFGVVNCLSNK